jgi:hypothetical protein
MDIISVAIVLMIVGVLFSFDDDDDKKPKQ